MIDINYDGLETADIISLATMMEQNKTVEEINAVFPGRATEIEEAVVAPEVKVACMFSVSEDTDLELLLININELLEEAKLPGDAEWVDLVEPARQDEQNALLNIINNEWR